VLHKLVEKNGEELWPYLVKHMDDEKYALTAEIDGDGKGENLSVGTICRAMVEKNLSEPFRRVLPSVVSVQRRDKGYVVSFHRSASFSTPEQWSASWKSKPLWTLQIELGEMLIRALEGLDVAPTPKVRSGLPGGGYPGGGYPFPQEMPPTELKGDQPPKEDKKASANGPRPAPQGPPEIRAMFAERERQVAQIKKIVDGIRRTKKPIVDNHHSPLSGELYHFFTE
jgi:hypothetical protein